MRYCVWLPRHPDPKFVEAAYFKQGSTDSVIVFFDEDDEPIGRIVGDCAVFEASGWNQ